MGNTPSKVPLASQISQINYPLQCNTQQYFDTYDSLLSATAPLYGRPGYVVSFTDVTANITLPAKFAPAARANGSDHFTANVELLWGSNMNLRWDDARQLLSFNQTWDDTTLDIFKPKLPVTLSQNGTTSLYVQGIFITTTARRPDGTVVSSTLTNCFLPSPYIISITVGDVAGPREPANGVQGQFPPIKSGQKASIGNVDLVCNNQLTTSLIIGGVGPANITSGQQIALSEFTSFFILPGQIVQQLAKVESSIFVELSKSSEGQDGTGDGLILQTKNASPQSFDFSRDFTASEPTRFPLNTGVYVPAGHDQPIHFGLPRFGNLSTNAFAGTGFASWENIGLNVTSVNVVIFTYSLQTGELTDRREYSCKPNSPHRLF